MSQITDISFPEAEGEGYDKSAVDSYLSQLDEFVRGINQKHQEELTSSTRAEEIAQSSRLIGHANEVSEKYITDAQAKAANLISEAQTEADALIDESSNDADTIRGDAEKELENAKAEATKIVEDAKESVIETLARVDAEAERARNIAAETQAKIDEVVRESTRDAELKHNDALAKAEEIVREADVYAAQTRDDALDLKTAVQAKAEEFLADAQAHSQSLVDGATAEAENILANANKEQADRLKHLQEEIDRAERLVEEFTEYREKTASRLLDFYTQQAAVLAEFAAPADHVTRPAQEVTDAHEIQEVTAVYVAPLPAEPVADESEDVNPVDVDTETDTEAPASPADAELDLDLADDSELELEVDADK